MFSFSICLLFVRNVQKVECSQELYLKKNKFKKKERRYGFIFEVFSFYFVLSLEFETVFLILQFN